MINKSLIIRCPEPTCHWAVLDGSLAKLYPCRVPGNVSILGRSCQQNVLKGVQVGPHRQLVHEGLPDIRGILESELVQGSRLLPLLHEPHPWNIKDSFKVSVLYIWVTLVLSDFYVECAFIVNYLYIERPLYWKTFILSDLYSELPLYWKTFILSDLYIERPLYWVIFILKDLYIEWHFIVNCLYSELPL